MNLKGRHFLTLKDYTPEEIAYLLELSADLKKKKKALRYVGASDVQIPLFFHVPMWYEKEYGQPKLRFLMQEQYHS